MEIVARYAKRNRVENTRSSKAWGSGGLCRWRHGCDHWVSGPLPFSDHFRQTPWLAVGAYRGTALFIANSLVQNLPNETTQAVSNGPDRLLVFQARLQALKDDFKNASFHLDCGVCGFMEQPPQSAVAFGRTATASFPRADFLARAHSHPGGQSLLRGEHLSLGTDLGDDLLGRFHPQTRNFGQSFHRPRMGL